jgi:hypothetical protein
MHLSPGRSAWTIFGWTPGLRQLVVGRVLACGCSVGLYETWDRRFVAIVDSAFERCESGHDVDHVLTSCRDADSPVSVALGDGLLP